MSSTDNMSRFEDTCFLDQEMKTNATFVDSLSLNIHTALSLGLDMIGNITALYELSHSMYELPPVLKSGQDAECMVTLTLE